MLSSTGISLKSFTTFVLLISVISVAGAQESKKPRPNTPTEEELRARQAAIRPRPSFYIQRGTKRPGTFSLLLNDANHRSIRRVFRAAQLDVFAAVLDEALQFGETDEEVGKITRFSDKDDQSLVVDVQKTATTSTFFVTISRRSSRLTVEAGSLTRADKSAHDLLAREMLIELRQARASN